KAIPMLGKGLDVPAVLVAENLAEHRDVAGKTALLDERVWPDTLHQLILLEAVPRILHQSKQGLVGFRRQWNGFIPAEQTPFDGVDVIWPEPVQVLVFWWHRRCKNFVRSLS